MDIFIILIIALSVAAYVGYPFWKQKETRLPAKRRTDFVTSPQLEDYQVEIELDRAAGRIEQQDYVALVQSKPVPPESDDEIERRVQALRKKRAESQSPKRSKRIKR